MKEYTRERLERVLEAMKQHAEHVDMRIWGGSIYSTNLPGCKTVGCLAGFACTVGDIGSTMPWLDGQDWLGLTHEEAFSLFYVANWPKVYHECLDSATPGTSVYVDVIRDRVAYFLATGE